MTGELTSGEIGNLKGRSLLNCFYLYTLPTYQLPNHLRFFSFGFHFIMDPSIFEIN